MVSDEEWSANIRKTIKGKLPDVTDEDIDLLDSSSSYWGAENYRSAAGWVGESIRLLSSSASEPDANLFTNLNGLIVEIPNFLKDKSKSFSVLGFKNNTEILEWIASIQDHVMKGHLQNLFDANNLAQQIRSAYTDDEIFLLSFVRHRFCHPTLSGYAVKIEGMLAESTFKVSKWKRLKELGSKTKIDEFRDELLSKLQTQVGTLYSLRTKLEMLTT